MKYCIADGISSAMFFEYRNAKSFEEAKNALNKKYISEEDFNNAVKEIFKDIEDMPEAYWVVVKDYIVSVRKKYMGR